MNTPGGWQGSRKSADATPLEPSTPGNWTGLPDDVAEALNQLAARVKTLEAGGGGGGGNVRRTVTVEYVSPAMASTSNVHDQHRGDGVNTFPGPITNPVIPRTLDAWFGVDWDGGTVTVSGTDQYDQPITEDYDAPIDGFGGLIYGTKAFKTVTGISKSAVGADASADNYVSFGGGSKLAFPPDVVGSADSVLSFAFRYRNAGGSPGSAQCDNTNKTVDLGYDLNGLENFYVLVDVTPGA